MARIFLIAVLAGFLLGGWGAADARADDSANARPESLADLYRAVLKDPANSKLSLRYARLAEVQGERRLALAAYERVILNDPNNREGQAGFTRLKRALEPSITQFRLEVGAGYDSNPLNRHSNIDGEPVFFANFTMRDERSVRSTRWRTLANLYGEYPLNVGELLYAYAGLQSGPLFDVSSRLTVYPALGVAFSSLDKRLFYGEGNASLTFEGRFGGAFQSMRVRAGYRSYGDGFTADKGYYADVVGRLTVPAGFHGRGAVLFVPWARWSGMGGAVLNQLNEELSPGRYAEWGGELGYYLKPVADLTFGVSVIARQRFFFHTRVADENRSDTYFAPGVNATRSNVLACVCDVLLDYRYRINNSNDPLSDYEGHRVTLSFASRF